MHDYIGEVASSCNRIIFLEVLVSIDWHEPTWQVVNLDHFLWCSGVGRVAPETGCQTGFCE